MTSSNTIAAANPNETLGIIAEKINLEICEFLS